MAMKVRFETRLENLQKEHTRLLTILDQMQHEKVLNQEIIKGVQKQMSLMKENYHKNLEKSKQQNEMLERHIKEVKQKLYLAKLWIHYNHCSGVLISMVASSAIDRRFNPLSSYVIIIETKVLLPQT